MGSVNERRRYIVTSSLIGWTHVQNDPWILADPVMTLLWVCTENASDWMGVGWGGVLLWYFYDYCYECEMDSLDFVSQVYKSNFQQLLLEINVAYLLL